MRSLVFLLFTLLLGCNNVSDVLREGDLLFKEVQNNAISNAISDVTDSTGSYRFSHIGVLIWHNNSWQVIEAAPKWGVRICPLKTFCSQVKGEASKVTVGRLKKGYHFNSNKLKEYAFLQIDKPYDYPFSWSDTAFYCSELAYKMFAYAGQNDAFALNVMTFKQSGCNFFDSTWVKYFESLNTPIPEGEMGINPNAMAKSNAVELLFELEY